MPSLSTLTLHCITAVLISFRFFYFILPGSDTNVDQVIKEWANNRVAKGPSDTENQPKPFVASLVKPMGSFSDKSLGTSVFFIYLMHCMSPRIVNWAIVTKGSSSEDKKLNARYAISIARKLGSQVFLVPEDLVEAKPKMILCFLAALLRVDKEEED